MAALPLPLYLSLQKLSHKQNDIEWNQKAFES